MNNKKAIIPLIGISLLMVVTIISIFSYQTWLISYSNDINIDVDDKGLGAKLTSIRIPYINADTIYLENTQDKDLKIVDIQLNGISCGGGTYPKGIVDIDLNCEYAFTESNINTGGSGSGKKRKSSKLLIITENEVVAKEYFNEIIIPVCTNETNEGFQGGNGSSISPWKICNCNMLQLIDNNSYNDDYFELTTDVDCSETRTWNNGDGFKPITTLRISLDGNGNAIKNLYINRPWESYVGLFNNNWQNDIDKGIKNLALLNVNITGNSYVGSFSGGGYITIKNSYSTGVVKGTTSYIGGLQGRHQIFTGSIFSNIIDSYTTVDIEANSFAGGLVGLSNKHAINSSFTLSKIKSNVFSGGIFGWTTTWDVGYCDNTFWNNNSNNPLSEVGVGDGCEDDEITIQDDESYFYGNENEPMASWDESIWSFNENRLPQLRKQN